MSIQIIDEVKPHEFNRCFIGICPSCKQDLLRGVELTTAIGGVFVECCNGCTIDQIASNPPILIETSFDEFLARSNKYQEQQATPVNTDGNEIETDKLHKRG